MNGKRRFLILALAFAWFGRDGARAQQKQPVSSEQEDCGVTFNFTAASSGAQAAGTTTAGSTGTTAIIDNRQSACVYWKVAYSPNSATASISLAFQTALDVAGTPTTWSNYPGTLDSGINPNTAVTTGGARTEASGVEYPFLRMNLTILTGAGARVQGKLTGWKSRPPITANAVIVPGSLCTAGAPCPVDGPTADGSPPVFPPVLVAGQDGANIQTMLTDTSGRPVVVGSKTHNSAVPGANNIGALVGLANAAAPTFTEGDEVLLSTDLGGSLRVLSTPSGTQTIQGNKSNNAVVPGATNLGVLPGIANAAAVTYTEGDQVLNSLDLAGNQRVGQVNQTGAATFERAFSCTNQALFNLSGSGDTQIIAASGATTIRICHISFSTTAAEDIKITRGTGANCGTGTADVTGLYKSVQSAAFDFSPNSALRGAASGAICLNQSAVQALGGVVIYAQF